MFASFNEAFSQSPFREEFETPEIRQWHTGRAVILRVFGELWSTNIEPFEEAIGRLIEPSKHVVVVDLTHVTFVGSQGISALLLLSKQVAANGAELRIVAPASGVRTTLELTHMQDVLKIHDSVAAALVDRPDTRA